MARRAPYRLAQRDLEHGLGVVGNLAHARAIAPSPDLVRRHRSRGDPTRVHDDLYLATAVCRHAFRDAILSDALALVLRGLRLRAV